VRGLLTACIFVQDLFRLHHH